MHEGAAVGDGAHADEALEVAPLGQQVREQVLRGDTAGLFEWMRHQLRPCAGKIFGVVSLLLAEQGVGSVRFRIQDLVNFNLKRLEQEKDNLPTAE